MKRQSKKAVKVVREQFDLFDAKQAPVARGTMRGVWNDWSAQYIPLRGTKLSEEIDFSV